MFLSADDVQFAQGLAEYDIPLGVTHINDSAFRNAALVTIRFPPTIKTIGSLAFANCTSLVNAVLPSTLKSIGGGAFAGCKSLVSVVLPSSLEMIETGAFFGTTIGNIEMISCRC